MKPILRSISHVASRVFGRSVDPVRNPLQWRPLPKGTSLPSQQDLARHVADAMTAQNAYDISIGYEGSRQTARLGHQSPSFAHRCEERILDDDTVSRIAAVFPHSDRLVNYRITLDPAHPYAVEIGVRRLNGSRIDVSCVRTRHQGRVSAAA
jgi:hypothetical protein